MRGVGREEGTTVRDRRYRRAGPEGESADTSE
jgi:hypothetical protein